MNKRKERSYLVINPYGIGDIVSSTPILRNIKLSNPNAKIGYMCNKRVKPLLRGHPFIDQVIVYERDDFYELKKKSLVKWAIAMSSFIRSIRKSKYDVAIDLSMNTKFGFFAIAGGIKKRIGFDFRKRGRLLTKKIKINGFHEKNIVEYYLDVLRLCDIPVVSHDVELYLSNAMKKWQEKYYRDIVKAQEKVICVAPCGGESFGPNANIKRWPAEKYAELINRIVKVYSCRIIVIAGRKEKEDVDYLKSMIDDLSCVEDALEYDIAQVAAIVEHSSLVISNDSAPLRFANAFNVKYIAFFGPVDENVYGPYPTNREAGSVLVKDMPCRPCYIHPRMKECHNNKKCLTQISVEEAFKEVKRLFVV